jgi:type IV pilus assembly protein PilM
MATAQGRAVREFLSNFLANLQSSAGKSSNCVGLSIGASSVKVVQISKKKTGYTLEHFGMASMLEGTSENRDIINSTSVVEAIQAALAQAKISNKDMCSAVTGSSLIIKTLSLVIGDEKELKDQVFWEAEQYIPFDMSEVVLDYQIIKKRGTQYDVILVAVKKNFLDQYMQAINDAALQPKIIDTEAFALQNAYEANYPTTNTEAMLLADIGALSTKIIVVAGGLPLFIKDAPFGGNSITLEIQRELRVSSADAEALKVSENLPREVAEVLMRMAQVMSTEVKKTIDFYTASSIGPPIVGVLLSGGGARSPGMTKMIEDSIGIPCSLLNPFQRVQGNSKNFSAEFLSSIAPEAVIPLGLAIRGMEGL